MNLTIGQEYGGGQTPRRGRPGRVPRALALLAFLVAACDIPLPRVVPLPAEAEETTPFSVVPTGQTWLNVPGATFVMQRGLVNSSEQRIGLRNQTAVPGDNMMVVRARDTAGQRGRLRFEEFMRRVGGPMTPFEDVTSGEMLDAVDGSGTYFWAERRFGVDTICVLGMRRLDGTGRQLPAGIDVMDILLRNCIRGTTEQALEPLLAASVAGGPAFGAGAGQTRMLSPLAAPTTGGAGR